MPKPQKQVRVVPTAMTVILATREQLEDYFRANKNRGNIPDMYTGPRSNIDDEKYLQRFPKDELFTLLAFSTGSKSRPGGQATFAGGKIEYYDPNRPFDKLPEVEKVELEKRAAIIEHLEETGIMPLGIQPLGRRIFAPIVTRAGTKIYSVKTFLATNGFRLATSADREAFGVTESKSTGTFARWVRVAEMEKLKKMMLPDVIRFTRWALLERARSPKRGGLGLPTVIEKRALYDRRRKIGTAMQKARAKQRIAKRTLRG